MIQRIRNAVLAVAALLALSAPALVPVSAYAASVNIEKNLCSGTNIDVTGGSGSGCDTSGNGGKVNTLLRNIVNIFSAIVGVIAVIMIIVGGLQYITSGGDSNKVSTAKNTIIYAIVGLVIVALAQLIVHFVLSQSSTLAK
ncbi:MAG TPA: pilin [Candidatus Saccharimonadales bacterium]|nr:pilin [Candidatus Saccharimonadales bacterium]